ncbi:MAG: bifunctional phosphopantothenoylcysteine decarboxylase/phosphopantothenate--cysteine ligase CoaBC [Calditerrivibrio sp.]|nr:bifunctional phosphopantothenoylcysteine decarboxylase/phosphopantothenate--cysteine ligase CoaBC [Calditerrivibrio sp.]MCA1932853.1 bifunctional phosphopantothenoylcysteine decarboxylase/phosphopantothenate--cysteine ligase CoaBC [Calditerrivibrio sp.]
MSNILIGVSGGIAAYKIPQLCRLFNLDGFNVKVVMTENATKFVTPLTFEAITGNRVYTDDFQVYIEPSNIKHISLPDWADIFIVAPATANTISKVANGIADNLLTSSILAYSSDKPLLIAPAMNSKMYSNRFFHRNLEYLSDNGINIVSPTKGILACGDEGIGKMAEPEQIFFAAKRLLKRSGLLKGKKILVTAGPTIEDIDPVRFISNRSSGKMGYAIAEAAYEMGGDVKLISGPTNLKTFLDKIDVYSAEDMYNAILREVTNSDIVIMSAAVADYRVAEKSNVKIKKNEDLFELKLIKNIDILKSISTMKREGQIFVGFAAETNDLEQNALKKLHDKKLDIIVANDISREDIGFNSDENEVRLFFKNSNTLSLEKMPKKNMAKKLLSIIANYKNDE